MFEVCHSKFAPPRQHLPHCCCCHSAARCIVTSPWLCARSKCQAEFNWASSTLSLYPVTWQLLHAWCGLERQWILRIWVITAKIIASFLFQLIIRAWEQLLRNLLSPSCSHIMVKQLCWFTVKAATSFTSLPHFLMSTCKNGCTQNH